jgi:hypothetical protein
MAIHDKASTEAAQRGIDRARQPLMVRIIPALKQTLTLRVIEM